MIARAPGSKQSSKTVRLFLHPSKAMKSVEPRSRWLHLQLMSSCCGSRDLFMMIVEIVPLMGVTASIVVFTIITTVTVRKNPQEGTGHGLAKPMLGQVMAQMA